MQPATQEECSDAASPGDAQTAQAGAGSKAPAWGRLIALPPRSALGIISITKMSSVLGRTTPQLDVAQIRCGAALLWPRPPARASR